MESRPCQPAIVAVAALLLSGPAAVAHEFSAPATVYVDAEGRFSYQTTLIVTSDVALAGSHIDGTDNTTVGEFFGDGFCQSTREPGVYTSTVSGWLVDITRPGSVFVEESLCDGFSGSATTTIVIAAVDAGPVSWTALKSQFR